MPERWQYFYSSWMCIQDSITTSFLQTVFVFICCILSTSHW